VLGPRFREALAYADEVHEGQRRKGTGVPYAGHVLGVCALVLEDGGDEDEAIAALLHDAVEDAGGHERLIDVRARFGERVASIVEHCTDTFESPKPPWRERKEAYVAHLEEAPPEVLRVSLADKLYNVRTILRGYRELGEALWDRFDGRREDVLWYYRALADLFERRGSGPMVWELSQAVAELERLVGAT
jgi:(p)ppGpp synthase/HD superfamily hydrolase